MYCCSCLVWVLLSYLYLLYCVCIAVFTLDAGLLARSQYSEGPATGHLDTGFSRFPCVYKQMLRRFPTFQVATTCFSCSLPDLNSVVTYFMFYVHVKQLLPPRYIPIAVYYYYYLLMLGIVVPENSSSSRSSGSRSSSSRSSSSSSRRRRSSSRRRRSC